jgi:hypothetical protein
MSGSGSTCRARTPAARADERVAAPQAETTTTPVDGVFAVHTVAGVVTPAQALLVVEPLKSHVEVKAGASNRDTGFVSPRAGRGDQGRYLQLHAAWRASLAKNVHGLLASSAMPVP